MHSYWTVQICLHLSGARQKVGGAKGCGAKSRQGNKRVEKERGKEATQNGRVIPPQ